MSQIQSVLAASPIKGQNLCGSLFSKKELETFATFLQFTIGKRQLWLPKSELVSRCQNNKFVVYPVINFYYIIAFKPPFCC